MSLLSRFRILPKILAVIVVLAVAAIGITLLGVGSLKQIAEQTGLVSRTSKEALLLARINTNLQAISANIYRITSDPRPESRSEAQKVIREESDVFKKRFATLSELVESRETKARLVEISNDAASLDAAIEKVYRAADAVQNFQMTDEMQHVRDVASATGKIADTVRTSLRKMMESYDQRVTAVNSEADALYLHISTLMIVIAGVGILFSLLLGFFIGHYGVAKPMRAIVALLQRLAGGEYDVEIDGAERKDEIGEVARTAVVFKENGLARIRMEKEQRELEQRAAAEREAAAANKLRMEQERQELEKRAATDREAEAQRLANEFEAAVGGIVKSAVAGDFSKRVALEGKSGLILSVGGSINALCENVGKALRDLIEMLNALAKGDLTKRITSDYQGDFAVLKDNANTTATEIGATITGVKQAAREVTNASAEISTSTTDLSQRTEEQAASLEQTSASMEQIAATVKKNAENAQEANQSAVTTRDLADRGGQVVAKAVSAMARIEESSDKISDIIGVIDEIARQTNLLALNAAVEAARAGEAGRGFAVVASEVRSLAQRSSQAAKDIKGLITSSSSQVKEGVGLVNEAGSALTEIVDSIKKVAGIVADIAAASLEQSGAIEQVNKALTQMDEVTQQNSALVEENAATAKTLEHQSTAMDERVSFFRIGATADDDTGEASTPTLRPASNGFGGRGHLHSVGATALKEELTEHTAAAGSA
jgi:methyl-accepting chemotaxis protein